MKTFISDLIPKLQRFSQKLDNLSLLTNQHWVAIDDIDNNKNVYIFRTNCDLLISRNGKIEKGKWEYLGNNSLLIERIDASYLFKHGFFDENILALKVDGKDEYAIFINENKYDGELNSLERVFDFLSRTYVEPQQRKVKNDHSDLGTNESTKFKRTEYVMVTYDTDKGKINVEQHNTFSFPEPALRVFKNGKPAPKGKYKLGFMWYVHIENGYITNVTLL
jgi:hypothetical protein